MLRIDSEVSAALHKLAGTAPAVRPAPVGDVAARRATIEPLYRTALRQVESPRDVDTTDTILTTADGGAIPLRLYRRRGDATEAAALYIHGGGMILGSLDITDPLARRYASEAGVTILAVDYRYAPEHPGTTPVEDCYAALRWLADSAADLGVDPRRLAVVGESAGGGLAAGVALLARDRGGPPLLAQFLIYPMLDDRTTVPDPTLERLLTWSYEDNATGWGALLGDAVGGPNVPACCAPARSADFAELPDAFVDVGELDIFRDESIDYARRLLAASISTELHVRPGAPHGFDVFAPMSRVSQTAWQDRVRALRRL